MGKADIFGEALWDQYSSKVADRMNNPRHMGEITEEEAKERGGKLIVADYGAESCGDAVRLFWLVDEKTDKIVDAKFKSFGCGTAIASSDMMAELCIGKTVDEAVKITNLDVEMALRDDPDIPAVPGQKMHCSPYFMPVQTPKGKVEIGKIQPGDEVAVYTANGIVNSKVKRVISYKTHKSNLVRLYLKTANGGVPGFYVFTKDHQLLDNQGNWVFVEDLKNGDIVSHVHESELDMQYAKLGKPRGSSKGEKNSLEAKYEEYFKSRNLPIRFVGDGSFWRWNGDRSSSMNPDFVFENENKVVEVTTSKLPFRDFEQYKRERVESFAEIGFDCYVIDDMNFDEVDFNNWTHNGYIVSPYRDLEGVHELTPRDWGTIERNGYKIEIDENDMVTVYTLEVEHEAHNYIQNGVISKNCSVMAYDVIKEAAAIYKGVDADSFEREIIVCECARVSLATIKEVIRLNDLKTVEEITDYTKAGAFCKSCIKPGGHEEREYYLVDILKEVRAEMEQEKLQQAVEASSSGNFEEMTTVQRLKAIEQVIDESIRQFLIADGGNLEIIDIRDSQDGYIDVYIRYLGACSTCATSTTGTLYAIETELKRALSDRIRVLPI